MKFIGHQLHIDESRLCPRPDKIFRAFELTNPETIRVVILGQDPYAQPGIADGLAFSCGANIIPYSLGVIYKELNRTGYNLRTQPSLLGWAQQGVLLLNTSLTTVNNHIGYHDKIGWNLFVRAAVNLIRTRKDIVYLGWGESAKNVLHDTLPEGEILLAAHPAASKYGSKATFAGCDHFRMANSYLEKCLHWPINWTS